jgi:16S rRNA (guanine527-N7)-methyltransferase
VTTRPEPEPADAALLGVLAEAQARGFLGPGPLEAPIRHARAFAALLPTDLPAEADLLDLGSGGGLPALPLALVWPSSQWTLVDAMRRRTSFLEEAVFTLGLAARVEVVTARAEALPVGWRGRFDAVTARGFGPPAVVAECSAPWTRVGGMVVISDPPGGGADRWSADGLALLGLVREISMVGPPALTGLRQRSACPDRFPRRTGIPLKRPLW